MIARLPRFTHPVALAALLVLVLAAPVSACSCGSRPSVEEMKSISRAVFTGIPISIVDYGPDFSLVTFQVTAVWKGAVTPQYAILTSDPQMCGVGFGLGSEWLVYGTPWDQAPDPEVQAHNCSRTALAAGNPDIEALGPPLTTPALRESWGAVKVLYR